MTAASLLTAAQRAQFDELGLLRFRAFSTEEATAMQEAVWRQLGRVMSGLSDRTSLDRVGAGST